MNKIIPSTKLKMISVHKLMDTTCWRKFFWRRVLNLESRSINENFWYGGVLGEGFEAMLRERDWRKAMAKEDRRRRKGYKVSNKAEENMKLNLRMIKAQLEAAKKLAVVKKMKITASQIKFSVPLKCGVSFCGSMDGEGKYANLPYMFEIKTAKQVKQSTLDALVFDKQINGYAWAMRKLGEPVSKCMYCIFKKQTRIVKQGQSLDEFVEEWREDLVYKDRQTFVWHSIALGRSQVTEVGHDIEQEAADLKAKFDRARGEEQLLDPHYWPRRENKCHDYSGCEFLPLCENMSKWKVMVERTDMYKQREMLYEKEREELSR